MVKFKVKKVKCKVKQIKFYLYNSLPFPPLHKTHLNSLNPTEWTKMCAEERCKNLFHWRKLCICRQTSLDIVYYKNYFRTSSIFFKNGLFYFKMLYFIAFTSLIKWIEKQIFWVLNNISHINFLNVSEEKLLYNFL